MFGKSLFSVARRAALLGLLLLAAMPLQAQQQTATITGRVTNDDGAAVPGATVRVADTRYAAQTDAQGRYSIALPAGRYNLKATLLGFKEAVINAVEVGAGQTRTVDILLYGAPVELAGLVVSASRRPERVTDAPATITKIDATVLENSVGNTFVGALKEVKGLDFIQVGVNSVGINARGFNSSFNNRMLMMEDGRIAVLPENGLPVGQFTATSKVDLAGIEVLVGPGSALYGADASSGVLYLETKDPRRFPGTTVEVTGGNRQYKDVQFRHAGVYNNFGYKVTGEFLDANDWENFLTYNIAGVPGRGTVAVEENKTPLPIDWTSRVARGTGALVYYSGNNRLEVTGGMSQSDGVGQTNVGRNQLNDWTYNFQQAKYSTPRWYLNLYRTQSQSGESFALNRFADAYARNPNLTPDSLRLLSDWPSNGQLYAAEVQNNFDLPWLMNTEVIWGGQARRDVVSSDRQWLTDRLTGEDVSINQFGVYAQTETGLAPWLNLVLAGRVDKHENYETQFSPKAGIVVKPSEFQAVRLTYNRAFKSPTILQTNFYIPDWTAVVAIFGNTEGFSIRNAAGAEVATYSPLVPEQNQTWEIGYKGVLADRLFVDVAGFHSDYENFLSPLAVISNPFVPNAGTFAYDANGVLIKNAAGLTPLVLTYYNLGRATLRGADGGITFAAHPKLDVKGTFGFVKLQDVEVPQGREEATALNSPETKWTLGANFRDVGNALGAVTLRRVNEYYFRSGINMGVIPGFTTLDMNFGYRIDRFNTLLNVGVSNLFACGQNEDAPFVYAPTDRFKVNPNNRDTQCGFGQKHIEMINMPAIGTMLFVGLKWETR